MTMPHLRPDQPQPDLPRLPADLRCAVGDHLIEVEVRRPCSPEVLTAGLARMGWTDVLLDQSVRSVPIASLKKAEVSDTDIREWGPVSQGSDAASSSTTNDLFDDPHTTRFRFVGRLARPILLRQRDDLVWIYAHRFSALDPFGDLRLRVKYFQLLPNHIYEIRLLSRLRAQPTRESICEALATMKLIAYKVTAMKKDMRIPGRAGASVTLWAGLAKWAKPNRAYITGADPLFFEDVLDVGEALP